MIYDISIGLNGNPLCINVYPINLQRNLCKFTDMLNWIPNQKQPSSTGGAIDLEWQYLIQFNWESNETIGCNSWTSSIGRATDLEWFNLFHFNWDWKEPMVSITWNRCNWCTSSIGGAIDLEWYYLNEFNWEWKETMVSITWRNRMQLMYFINWMSNWSGMILSQWIQLGIKGNNGINYME